MSTLHTVSRMACVPHPSTDKTSRKVAQWNKLGAALPNTVDASAIASFAGDWRTHPAAFMQAGHPFPRTTPPCCCICVGPLIVSLLETVGGQLAGVTAAPNAACCNMLAAPSWRLQAIARTLLHNVLVEAQHPAQNSDTMNKTNAA